MERARVTRGWREFPNEGSAVPAGDRLPIRFAFHPIAQIRRNGIFELDAAFLGRSPDDRRHRVEWPYDHENVFAWRGEITRRKLGAFRRQIRDDDRARAAEAEGRAR